jgi:hypothetical protein
MFDDQDYNSKLSPTFDRNGASTAHWIHDDVPHLDVCHREDVAADGGAEGGGAKVADVPLKKAFRVQRDSVVDSL